MKIFISLTAPYYWTVVDKNGQIDGTGTAQDLEEINLPKSARVVGVVPGDAVVIHQVAIPARSASKIKAAVPFALEDQLATDVEGLFFAVLGRAEDGTVRVAVVERTQMQAWRDAADALARPLDAMVPEYCLLPFHPQAGVTIAAVADQQACIRSKHHWGACLDLDSVSLWWQELADDNAAVAINDVALARSLVKQGGNLVKQWDIGATFPEWLRYNAADDVATFDLLQDDYAPAHHSGGVRGYKIAAAVLLLALLVRGLFDGYEFVKLRAAERELDRAMTTSLLTAFPKARIQQAVSKRADMASRLKRLQTGVGEGEFQRLLAVVAQAVRASGAGAVKLQAVNFRQQELLITCVTDSFDQLNRFKDALSKAAYIDASLTSSSSLESTVTGKFSLKRKTQS